LTQRVLGNKKSKVDGRTSKNGSKEKFRASLPVTVVAELELNSVKPPPDKSKEEREFTRITALMKRQVTLESTKSVK
jgi:hypothetical protein